MSAKRVFVVELYEKMWLAPNDWGDPGRTCLLENAKTYSTKEHAKKALEKARSDYPYRKMPDAHVVECIETTTICELCKNGISECSQKGREG